MIIYLRLSIDDLSFTLNSEVLLADWSRGWKMEWFIQCVLHRFLPLMTETSEYPYFNYHHNMAMTFFIEDCLWLHMCASLPVVETFIRIWQCTHTVSVLWDSGECSTWNVRHFPVRHTRFRHSTPSYWKYQRQSSSMYATTSSPLTLSQEQGRDEYWIPFQ